MISPIQLSQQPTFGAKIHLTPSGVKRLSGEAASQANSLREICKEIFSGISNNKNILKAATGLTGIGLAQTAVTFYEENNKAVTLSMPENNEDNFTIQVSKNEKPQETITIDRFNKIINFSSEINEKSDEKSINSFVENIYQNIDEPLFRIRLFIKKKVSTLNEKRISAIILAEQTETPEEKKLKAVSAAKTYTTFTEYSMRELINQNAGNITHKPRIRSKFNSILATRKERALKPIKPETNNIKKEEDKQISTTVVIPTVTPTIVSNKKSTTTPNVVSKDKPKITPVVTPETKKEAVIKVEADKTNQENCKKTPAILTEKENIQTEPRRRGRPTGSKSPKVLQKLHDALPDGILPLKYKEKFDEILTLKNEIFQFFRDYSNVSGTHIRNTYKKDVKTSKNKILFNNNLLVNIPRRKEFPEYNAVSIVDSKRGVTINVVAGEKVIANDVNWAYKATLPKIKYLKQAEIDEMIKDDTFNNIIDELLTSLRDFKTFLFNKQWRLRAVADKLKDSVETKDFKEFFEATMNEVQESAKTMEDSASFRSAVDIISKMLREKFDEYFEKHQQSDDVEI